MAQFTFAYGSPGEKHPAKAKIFSIKKEKIMVTPYNS